MKFLLTVVCAVAAGWGQETENLKIERVKVDGREVVMLRNLRNVGVEAYVVRWESGSANHGSFGTVLRDGAFLGVAEVLGAGEVKEVAGVGAGDVEVGAVYRDGVKAGSEELTEFIFVARARMRGNLAPIRSGVRQMARAAKSPAELLEQIQTDSRRRRADARRIAMDGLGSSGAASPWAAVLADSIAWETVMKAAREEATVEAMTGRIYAALDQLEARLMAAAR